MSKLPWPPTSLKDQYVLLWVKNNADLFLKIKQLLLLCQAKIIDHITPDIAQVPLYVIESIPTINKTKPEFQAPSYIGISKRTQQMFHASKTQTNNNPLNTSSNNNINEKNINNKSLSAEMGKGRYKYEYESFLNKGFPWTFVAAEDCCSALEGLLYGNDKPSSSTSNSVPCCTINDYKGRYITLKKEYPLHKNKPTHPILYLDTPTHASPFVHPDKALLRANKPVAPPVFINKDTLNDSAGYCELCSESYKSLKGHLKSRIHLCNSLNTKLFRCIDEVIENSKTILQNRNNPDRLKRYSEFENYKKLMLDLTPDSKMDGFPENCEPFLSPIKTIGASFTNKENRNNNILSSSRKLEPFESLITPISKHKPTNIPFSNIPDPLLSTPVVKLVPFGISNPTKVDNEVGLNASNQSIISAISSGYTFPKNDSVMINSALNNSRLSNVNTSAIENLNLSLAAGEISGNFTGNISNMNESNVEPENISFVTPKKVKKSPSDGTSDKNMNKLKRELRSDFNPTFIGDILSNTPSTQTRNSRRFTEIKLNVSKSPTDTLLDTKNQALIITETPKNKLKTNSFSISNSTNLVSNVLYEPNFKTPQKPANIISNKPSSSHSNFLNNNTKEFDLDAQVSRPIESNNLISNPECSGEPEDSQSDADIYFFGKSINNSKQISSLKNNNNSKKIAEADIELKTCDSEEVDIFKSKTKTIKPIGFSGNISFFSNINSKTINTPRMSDPSPIKSLTKDKVVSFKTVEINHKAIPPTSVLSADDSRSSIIATTSSKKNNKKRLYPVSSPTSSQISGTLNSSVKKSKINPELLVDLDNGSNNLIIKDSNSLTNSHAEASTNKKKLSGVYGKII